MVGTRPSVEVKGSGTLMFGAFSDAARPIGSLTIPPWLHAQPASLVQTGDRIEVPRITRLRPGESVLVTDTPGVKMFVNSPPGSSVGMVSCRNRPESCSHVPNV